METLQAFWIYIKDFNIFSVVLRLLLSALAGAAVGVERAAHGRAAGLRTHMTVALGSAMTVMVGLYAVQTMGMDSDPLRISAQVISGLGFLGAGTILLRRGGSQIQGLTTAAGLWAVATIGIAMGIGFYEGAIMATLAVTLILSIISRVEFRMNRKRQRMSVYLEISNVNAVKATIATLKQDYGAIECQVTPPRSATAPHVGIEALIRMPPKVDIEKKLEKLGRIENVVFTLQNF
ncbi:MAG: MgtC/SapB family protein [Ruminococcaceae bacterium]|nr:MgtC/SapB family protein [Oscillospiraceae bacterium]